MKSSSFHDLVSFLSFFYTDAQITLNWLFVETEKEKTIDFHFDQVVWWGWTKKKNGSMRNEKKNFCRRLSNERFVIFFERDRKLYVGVWAPLAETKKKKIFLFATRIKKSEDEISNLILQHCRLLRWPTAIEWRSFRGRVAEKRFSFGRLSDFFFVLRLTFRFFADGGSEQVESASSLSSNKKNKEKSNFDPETIFTIADFVVFVWDRWTIDALRSKRASFNWRSVSRRTERSRSVFRQENSWKHFQIDEIRCGLDSSLVIKPNHGSFSLSNI